MYPHENQTKFHCTVLKQKRPLKPNYRTIITRNRFTQIRTQIYPLKTANNWTLVIWQHTWSYFIICSSFNHLACALSKYFIAIKTFLRTNAFHTLKSLIDSINKMVKCTSIFEPNELGFWFRAFAVCLGFIRWFTVAYVFNSPLKCVV